MAQGRGSACAAGAAVLLIFAVVSLCSHPALATTYTVGGAKGWDVNVDYTSWAAGLTFKDGDILFFPYGASQHDVVVVDKAGYDGCSAASATNTFTDGNTNVTLSGTGAHYYICSFPGHCSAGMKLAVTISAAASAPAPSTTPPPSAPPPAPATALASPPPAKTPASSPVRTPATSPSPSPSLTPAPSSSTPAPAPSSAVTPTAPAPSSAETPTAPASSSATPGSTPSGATSPPSSPLSPPSAAHCLQLSAALVSCLAMAALLLSF